MLKILVAVDGSETSSRAVQFLVKKSAWFKEPLDVHLLAVQMPVVGVNVKLFISQKSLDDYYREAGTAALARAREILDAAGIRYTHHIGLGDPAQVIAEYADAKACDQILMGNRGLGAVGGLVLGSVATKVMHLAKVPVTLVK